MENTAVQEFWKRACDANPEIDPAAPFQVWHFGNTREMAKDLAALVVAGKKIATASLQEINEIKPAEAPVLHGYSVVTDFDGTPVCVIQTTEIEQMPFNEVPADFAFAEGEGDQSLEYWRGVHADYFLQEAFEHGFEFNERSIVCCERFRPLFAEEPTVSAIRFA